MKFENMDEKKYLINIDFTTTSKIHLNGELHKIDIRCKPREKNKKYGGWVSYSKEEIQKFVDKSEKLSFDEREVTNLVRCDLCAKNKEYDFGDLVDLKKLEVASTVAPKLEYQINHKKIILFLDDIKDDVRKIVYNLHYFIDDEELRRSFSYSLNVFTQSIQKGKYQVEQKRYQQGLLDHGFFSPELERKLDLYYSARSSYEFPLKQVEDVQSNEKKKWYHKLWKPVKKHLGIIDVILGSLSSVIPVLGAATEYKETVEYAIENSEEE